MMRSYRIGVDLGGSETRAGLVDRDGRVSHFVMTRTDAAGGPAAVIDQIEALIGAVLRQVAGASIVGVGVGAPGPLDSRAGVAIAPPTLSGWDDVPLVALLEERLRLPVRLDNDANVAALAEWRHGAGQGTQDMVFVTVSTGIGGGVVADGRLLRGRRGLAAEIGHMTLAEGQERCFCGALGCWEGLASGSALAARANRRLTAGAVSIMAPNVAAGPVTAREVGEAARAGDALALRLLAEEAHWLGVGFVNLLHLYSPERIVVGGGVAACLDLMQADIDRVVATRAMPPYRDVPVVGVALGGRAGVIGAACLFD